MSLKARFVALSVVLVLLFATFGLFFIKAYHSRFPILQRTFYGAAPGSGDPSNADYSPYPG